MKKSVINLFGALAFVALSTVSGQAAGTDTWVGNTDATWNTAGNWDTAVVPANGDSLVFGAAGSKGATLNNNVSSLSVNNFTINSSASGFTFNGNALTLAGTLTDNAGTGETISLALGGAGGLNNAGTSRMYLKGNNTYSGATTIGSSAAIEGDVAAAYSANSDYTVNGVLESYTGSGGFSMTMGALNGSGNVYNTGSGANQTTTLTVGATGNSGSFSGNINNGAWGSQKTALTKSGAGTQTLSGVNTYTGVTTVSAGALNYSGTLGVSPATAAAQINVGVAGGGNATLNIQSGANIRMNNANILAGNGTTVPVGDGFVFQSGSSTITGMNQLQLGAAGSGASYGYYNLSGSASVSLGELDLGGFNGAAVGVLDISAGTMNVSAWCVPSRGTGGAGILNLTGGTFNFTGAAGQFSANWNGGTVGTAVINVANASLIASPADVNMMQTGGSGKLGEINLLSGGLMQVHSITPGSATGTSSVNFNGGTLKANTANTTFIGANNIAVNVYGGGGTIDNNGIAITIPKALLAPAGNGINSAVTFTGGSGYVGAPAVTISGGGGTGAAGYATISGGAVNGIVVTCPGTGYTSVPTVTLTGGGYSSAATATAPTPSANTSGGMVFTGSGTTTLSTANTFTGTTTVSNGTLVISGSLVGGATVAGGTLNVSGTVSGAVSVNGGSLTVAGGTVSGAVTVNPGGAIIPSTGNFSSLVTLSAGNSAVNLQDGSATTTAFANGLTLNNGNVLDFDLGSSSDQISVPGTFTHNGTTTINLAVIGGFSATTYTLITDAANDITSTNGFVVGTVPSGFSAVLGNSGGALTVTLTQSAPNVAYWKGGLDNAWNTVSGGNANWTTDAAGTVNTVVPPGEPTAVTFAATGAGNFSTVLGANFTINNLTLSTANNVTIAGAANSLTIVAGLTNASTALNNVISVSNLVLSTTETVENDSASPLAISSLISGSSGLNTAGAGVIVLTSTNNSYTGGTSIGAGTLQVGDKVTSNGAITGPVTNNGELLIANPAAQTLSSAVTGTGVLGKTGAGVLDLPNANTYTGGTVVSNGTLQIENNSALGTATETMTTSPVTNNGIINLNIGVAGTSAGRWFFNPLVGNGTINVIETPNVETRLDGNMSGFTGTILVPASVATAKVDIEGFAVWNSAATIIVSNGGTLFVESATLTNDWAGQAEQVAATVYVSGSGNSEGYGALRVDDAAVLTGNVVLQGNTVYGGAYDHHGRSGISGVISDGGLGYGISCANTISGQAEEFWGANTYSGGTTWTNAAYTLVLGNGSALQNSTLNIGPGQLLFDSVVTSNAFLFGGLSGTANVTLTNGTGAVALTVGNNNSSTVYNGSLSDAGMGASLTKIGTGSLTLGGADSYSGLTTIAGGTLVMSTAQTNATTGIAVNDGATLTLEVAGTHQLAPASYTLGSSGGPVTNGFAGLTSTAVAPVNAGSVTLNGPIIVNIIGGSFTVGQTYPLISFTSISGSGGFALGTLPRGLSAGIVTNGGNTIAMYVTAYTPSFDVWTGAVNTNWDINGTSNWLVSGVANTYLDGDNTWFDDTAVSTNVFVTAMVSPNSMVISNNTTTYTFAGSAIAGVASLTKLGTGLLVLNDTNTYLGNTVISNGTVRLGGINVIPGGSGKGDVILNGTLDLNGKNETINGLSGSGTVDTVAGGTPTLTIGSSGSSSEFEGILQNSAGTLTVTKNGSGTLTLGGNNSYSGATTVSGGTLKLANANALGSTADATTVSANSTLDLNGQTIAENITLNSGASLFNTSTSAAISGKITAANSSFTVIGGTGNITFATITSGGGQFDITNLNSGIVDLAGTVDNGYMNLHVAAGTVILDKTGAVGQRATSALFVEGGIAQLSGTTGDQIFDGNTVTINSGTLDMNGRNETVGNLVGAGGVILNSAASTTGTLTIGGLNASLGDFKGVIENGAGTVALTKTGTGSAYLEGVNTYTGNTLINGGIVYLAYDASIGNSAMINIAGGATLDLSYLNNGGIMTLNSGQTLAGAGTVNGSVTSVAGSTINPGGGVAVSTLTVSSATLGGLLLMDLNQTNTPSNCDQLAGSITYGGTLVATNIGQDLQVGDTFQLFPSAAIGFAQITLPATNSIGYVYTWTNGVAMDGSISVLAVNPPVLVSTNAYLTSLVFNPTLGFAPAFTTNGWLYYETNAYLSTPTVTVTNADATATNTLIVNGVSLGILTNETASVPLTLGVGSTNVVQVQVVAQDGVTTNIYTVDVTMQEPSLDTNNLLTYLAVNPPGGILSGFVSNTITYSVTNYLPSNPVTVTVTNADATATNSLFFQGSYVSGLAATGATSSALTLTQGVANVVQVQVVSQSGATNTYTVNVTLQPNQSVPHLTNRVSGSTLTLSWPADHLGYHLLVQTNNLNKGVSSNINDWGTVAGSQLIITTNITMPKTNLNEYYRLVYP